MTSTTTGLEYPCTLESVKYHSSASSSSKSLLPGFDLTLASSHRLHVVLRIDFMHLLITHKALRGHTPGYLTATSLIAPSDPQINR